MGLLLARGLIGAKNVPLSDLWSEEWGLDIFRKTMSRNRFKEIQRYLRFDDRVSRRQRLQNDKFTLFSEIWDMFITNCQNHYMPTEDLTVDEQLFPTKCRCRFTQFMPQKPDKYGIKFWILSEVESKYLLNAIPYLGKDDGRSTKGLGEQVTLQLVEPYKNKGYHITTDQFFTSLSLAKKLAQSKISLLGTIRSDRREVPKLTRQPLYSSAFYHSEDGTLLTCYQAKKNKMCYVLSTRHEFGTICHENRKQKPNTILCYNKTKTAVDTLDQMARASSVKSGVRRWPLALFFNVVDLAAINAYVLFRKVTGRSVTRRQFLKELAKALVCSHQRFRAISPSGDNTPATGISLKRRQCHSCRNKTSSICFSCSRPVCGSCIQSKIVKVRCTTCL